MARSLGTKVICSLTGLENFASNDYLKKAELGGNRGSTNAKRYTQCKQKWIISLDSDYKLTQDRIIIEQSSSKVELSKNPVEYSRSQVTSNGIKNDFGSDDKSGFGHSLNDLDQRGSLGGDFVVPGSQKKVDERLARQAAFEKEGFFVNQFDVILHYNPS